MTTSKHETSQRDDVERVISFGIIDILRIFGGILVFNCLFSYWFTSSTTWGYNGKYIDPHYMRFQFTNYVNLTLEELSKFDGSHPNLPIYIGIDGKVYDVSASKNIYGTRGPYNFFSGRDAARAFVTGCFNKPDEFTYDLRGLDREEAQHDIKQWQEFFHNHNKYWYVGTVQHEDIIGDPPAPCQHMKFPGHG